VSAAFAQGLRRSPNEQTSAFWRELRDPGYTRSEELIEQGIAFLGGLGDIPASDPLVHAMIRSAVLRFEHAVTLAPQSKRGWYFLGYALARFEHFDRELGTTVRRDEEAIAAFEHLQSLDALFRVEAVGFELGLLNTRVARFDAAVREYQRSIQYALTPENSAVTYSNMAEVRMMDGDLIGAVRDYERAIHLSRNTNSADARGLPLFGIAVALDRLGETSEGGTRALEAVNVGLGIDILHRNGVFFEPACEVHYYEALGNRALAERAQGEERLTALRAALRSWRTYLSLAAEDDPWRSLVERRVETARVELEEARPERTSRRSARPSPR
jgi:tetratricopeptide (TPR) repeat protein